ncbi:MAG: T9SS C-terminal target domain-containing protein [Spirosomataceae bacterium]
MKKLSYLFLLSLGLTLINACNRGDDEEEIVIPAPSNRKVVEVSGKITANTTWKESEKYLLKGFVYVEAGATLTIEPGTIVLGDKASKGSLIIKPGAKIIARGTSVKPIVFTSAQAKGSRNYGDWGGLIILGNAKVNKTPATIEGENVSTFGGSDDADNSGVLKYVRIEFAGIAFETDKEINGLTLGGVGSGTEIDYVQVSFNGDDAYEWFGGTVNAKHLVSFKNLDDDFDTDWGYSGNVQYAYSLRDPNVADQCSCSDSNGFESDNDASGSNATPQTSAKFANVSVFIAQGNVNAKYRSALRLRRNTSISVYNSIFVGDWQARGGLELEGTATQDNFKNGKMQLSGIIMAGMVKGKPLVSGDETMLRDVARKNQFGPAIDALGLPTNFNIASGKPGLALASSSKLIGAGVTLPSGFESNTNIGAFGTSDWTEGWTNWDPQNADY